MLLLGLQYAKDSPWNLVNMQIDLGWDLGLCILTSSWETLMLLPGDRALNSAKSRSKSELSTFEFLFRRESPYTIDPHQLGLFLAV